MLAILRFPDLKAKKGLGFTRRHITRLEAVGKFPRHITLSEDGRAIGWIEDEVDAYITARIAARDRALVGRACSEGSSLPGPEGEAGIRRHARDIPQEASRDVAGRDNPASAA